MEPMAVWDGSSETNETITNGRYNPMVATRRSHPTMRKASSRPREARGRPHLHVASSIGRPSSAAITRPSIGT